MANKDNKRLKIFLSILLFITLILQIINIFYITKANNFNIKLSDILYFLFLYILSFSFVLIIPIGIRGTITIELGNILLLPSLLFLGYNYSIIIGPLGYFLALYLKKIETNKIIYNISNLTISLSIAGILIYKIPDLNNLTIEKIIYIFLFFIVLTLISLILFIILSNTLNERFNFKNLYISYIDEFKHLFYVVIVFLTPLSIITSILYPHNKLILLLIIILLYIISRITKEINEVAKHTNKSIESLVKLLEANDIYTAGHSNRVAHYAKEIAKALNLPDKEIKIIFNAGKIHDIGKIYIDDSIIRKKGALSEDEFQQMKYHPKIFDIILKDFKQLEKEINIAKYHHERWDGKGYPYKLKGEQIPLGARILTIADAFDALTSGRPYKDWMDEKTVYNIIIKDSGKRYDPKVIQAFKKAYHSESFQNLIKKYKMQEAKRRNALLKNYQKLLSKMLIQGSNIKK